MKREYKRRPFDHYVGFIIGFALAGFISPLIMDISLSHALRNSYFYIWGVLSVWFAFEVFPDLMEKWDRYMKRRAEDKAVIDIVRKHLSSTE